MWCIDKIRVALKERMVKHLYISLREVYNLLVDTLRDTGRG